jgi:hypothetical protein
MIQQSFSWGYTERNERQVTTKAPAQPCSLQHYSPFWKEPRCPSTDEWIKKMWYLYKMEFYSAMKKNEILSFAGKWMDLENIILSEVSHAEIKNHVLPHMQTLDLGQMQQCGWIWIT